ncbi:PLDc N-terminal domain-containing protein [Halarcobacter sp.]|uniref:PLDc N-terminal domain-containing protein n=1 Tax=Halarcobacter sp. TaxID=2321133 RepID=UPI002AAAEC16|nr:PLDc N-terminal domain-containing protein [Halarcobacter sp.]
MTRNQKIYYESLLISDKMNGKNEAEKYIKELQSRPQNINEKNKIEIPYIKYKWTLGLTVFYIIMLVLIFTAGMSENKQLHNLMSQIQNDNNKINKMVGLKEYNFYKDKKLVYEEINNLGIILSAIAITIYVILNIYCIFLILTNEFEKENDKFIWLIAIIFIPIAFMFFLDLKNKLLKY